MRTIFLDITTLDKEIIRDLMGFTLTVGLNFRKVNFIEKDNTIKDLLLIETETRKEEKALKDKLMTLNIPEMMSSNDKNEIIKDKKRIGILTLNNNSENNYILDKSTGRKFSVVR